MNTPSQCSRHGQTSGRLKDQERRSPSCAWVRRIEEAFTGNDGPRRLDARAPVGFAALVRGGVLALALALLAGCASVPPPSDIVSRVSGREGDFQILESAYSPDRREAGLSLLVPAGSAQFNVHVAGLKLEQLTLIFLKQQTCEGLTFLPRVGAEIDLKRVQDVQITSRGNDLAVVFGPAALRILAQGGRLQFVNQGR